MNPADRAARREEIACGDVPQPSPLKQPPTRLPSGCEAPANVPAQVFFAPSASAVTETLPTPVPGGVLVESNQRSVACADVEGKGPIGSTVVVSHGTFSDYFYFQSVEGITTSQLRYIDSLDEETLNSVMAAVDSALDAGGTEEEQAALLEAAAAVIAGLVVIPIERARLVVTELVSIKEALNELAVQAGEGALDCYWTNQAVSAECDEGALETPGVDGVPAVNPSEVVEGVYQSHSSQEDADAIAQLAADSSLVCVWGNVETTKTCVDLDPAFSVAVPTDEAPVGSMELARVGSVTVPANTVFSTVGQADADAQAAVLALQGLVCFYINEEVTRTCSDLEKEGTAGTAGDYLAGIPGNSITVPEGSILSLISTSAANAAAAVAAEQLLQCVWINVDQIATCLSVLEDPPDEGEEPALFPKSPVYTYTVPAGTVTSETSQEDADDTAMALAEAQLDCVYCNKQIDATCVDLLGGDVSLDKTAVVLAGTFCAGSFDEAQALAISVASVPDAVKSTAETDAAYGCRYGNAEVTVKCFGLAGDDGSTADYFGITGLKKFTVADMSAPTLLTPNNLNDAHVVMARDTIVLALSEIPAGPDRATPQAYVDNFAKNLAMSMLTCIFGNAEVTSHLDCPSGTVLVQRGTVAPNVVQSMISQADADDQAEILAESMQVCIPNDLINPPSPAMSADPKPDCHWAIDEAKAAILAQFTTDAPDSGTIVSFSNSAVYKLDLTLGTTYPDRDIYFFNIQIVGVDFYATALELPCDDERNHPFKIVRRDASTDSPDSPVYGIFYKSNLYLSRTPDDTFDIDGLLGSENPDYGDPGWQGSLAPGIKAWLEITFDESGEVVSAEIQWSHESSYDTSARAWSGGNGYCEDNGDTEHPYHKTSRILIGELQSDPSSVYLKVEQSIKRHLLLVDVSIDGRSARYPEEAGGGL